MAAALVEALASTNTNSSGTPYSGYLVVVYAAGTSTEVAVWYDRAQTDPSASGVTRFSLDTTGRKNVYANSQNDYKVFEPGADPSVDSPVFSILGLDIGAPGTVTDYSALQATSSTTDGALVLVGYRSAVGDGGGDSFYWDSSDLSAEVAADPGKIIFVAPDSDSTGASGAWRRPEVGFVSLLWAGVDNTGSTDCATEFARAIVQSVVVPGFGHVKVPRGKYKVASNINILHRNVKIVGAMGDNWLPDNGGGTSDRFGTEISFTGSGDLFTLGTDTGQYAGTPWTAYYDGYQSLTIENILMVNNNTDTALNNGQGSYQDGSAGLRDYRGGDIKLNNVGFKNFHYGFWGHQSDINTFNQIDANACKVGVYLGPRSDQNVFKNPYILLCDVAVDIDGASHSDWYSPVFVGNGSDTEEGIVIRKATRSHNFYSPWFEHYQGQASGNKAFVEIGVTAEVSGTFDVLALNINFINPIILTNAVGVDYHVPYLLSIDKGEHIAITNPAPGQGFYNVISLVELISDNAYCYIQTSDINWEYQLYTITGGTGAGASAEISRIHKQFLGGRVYIRDIPADTERDFYLTNEVKDRAVSFVFNQLGTDFSTLVEFGGKKFLTNYLARASTPPGSLTWKVGDMFTYTDPIAGGFLGEVVTAAGTQGAYSEGLTASITSGQTTVTLSGSTSVLKKEQHIKIAGAGPASADLDTVITSVSGDTVEINDAAGTTVSGAAVSYNAATFKEFGAIAS